MISFNFAFISNLQYKVKVLTEQVMAFKSGEVYTALHASYKNQLSASNREIKGLKQELAEARCQISTMNENWLDVFDDIQKEHEKELAKKDREIESLKNRRLATEEKLAEAKGKFREMSKKFYAASTALDEERGVTQKLTAQINRDHENSSLSSSTKPGHKKIRNSREKTGRKPGGQPGHEWHGRKKQEPTQTVDIPSPAEFTEDPNYKPTGNIITKQVVNIRIDLDVVEYRAIEFRNVRTGQRVHADFPEGVNDDVNYGGSVKAFAFLLNNRHNVSIDNARIFLSELTDGRLEISKGMINGLCREFSEKTQEEQRKAFSDLLLSPVMHVDFTNSRIDGKSAHVMVCATPETVLYFAREHKGHEGIKGTPVEDYQNTLVHDHDKTFLKYARWHQECLAHILRYLLDSIENEPHLTWSKNMRELIREMIHYMNGLEEDEFPDPEKVKVFETGYQNILNTAKEEYEYEPPTKYYKEGFNLAKRMDKYKENHLRFLHDKNVPATNNLAERLLRKFKRKQKQIMTFRSFENLDYLCNCISIISLLSNKDENLFANAASIFDKQINVS